MNMFELKSSRTQNFQSSMNELTIRIKREEKRSMELEGRMTEITRCEQEKERRLGGKDLGESAEPDKGFNIHATGVSERGQKEQGSST